MALQRGPQEDRRDVHHAGDGDAAAWLLRRHPDALAAGAGDERAGLPAAGPLQPDLHGPRDDDDLLRRDAVRDRSHELRRAAAARHARRGIPDAELGRLLADGHRRAAGQHLAVRRRVCAHRLAAVSAAVRAAVLPGRRRRLLPVGAADLRGRDPAVRGQPGDDGAQGACTRHELPAHADVLLDHARFQPADRRRVPDPHRDLRDAAARPLPRLPLLHERRRRQPDDVHEPDLGLGSPRGLYPGPARVRRLLRSLLDLLAQAALRLPLDGDRDDGDLRARVHGLAAPLLHDGRAATSTRSSASRR